MKREEMLTFRHFMLEDKQLYLCMVDAFYHSEAVLHSVPRLNYETTFATLMDGSPYVDAYLFQTQKGEAVGYALLAKTFSQEAGGLVIWVEELFLWPQYRNLGYGSAFFAFLKKRYIGVARFRLEVEPDNLLAKTLYGRWGFSRLPYEQMLIEQSSKNNDG